LSNQGYPAKGLKVLFLLSVTPCPCPIRPCSYTTNSSLCTYALSCTKLWLFTLGVMSKRSAHAWRSCSLFLLPGGNIGLNSVSKQSEWKRWPQGNR